MLMTWHGFCDMEKKLDIKDHLSVVMEVSDNEDAPTLCGIMYPPLDFHNTSVTIEGIIISFL